jgi:hypothetical protein
VTAGDAVRVDLAVDWWGGSSADLEDAVIDALESVGGQLDAGGSVHLDVEAQRRLRREAQMIRNRSQIVRNLAMTAAMRQQVLEGRSWVLGTSGSLRRSRAVLARTA